MQRIDVYGFEERYRLIKEKLAQSTVPTNQQLLEANNVWIQENRKE